MGTIGHNPVNLSTLNHSFDPVSPRNGSTSSNLTNMETSNNNVDIGHNINSGSNGHGNDTSTISPRTSSADDNFINQNGKRAAFAMNPFYSSFIVDSVNNRIDDIEIMPISKLNRQEMSSISSAISRSISDKESISIASKTPGHQYTRISHALSQQNNRAPLNDATHSSNLTSTPSLSPRTSSSSIFEPQVITKKSLSTSLPNSPLTNTPALNRSSSSVLGSVMVPNEASISATTTHNLTTKCDIPVPTTNFISTTSTSSSGPVPAPLISSPAVIAANVSTAGSNTQPTTDYPKTTRRKMAHRSFNNQFDPVDQVDSSKKPADSSIKVTETTASAPQFISNKVNGFSHFATRNHHGPIMQKASSVDNDNSASLKQLKNLQTSTPPNLPTSQFESWKSVGSIDVIKMQNPSFSLNNPKNQNHSHHHNTALPHPSVSFTSTPQSKNIINPSSPQQQMASQSKNLNNQYIPSNSVSNNAKGTTYGINMVSGWHEVNSFAVSSIKNKYTENSTQNSSANGNSTIGDGTGNNINMNYNASPSNISSGNKGTNGGVAGNPGGSSGTSGSSGSGGSGGSSGSGTNNNDPPADKNDKAVAQVFQCKKCNQILSDSYAFEGALSDDDSLSIIVVNSILPGSVKLFDEISMSNNGSDRGASFLLIQCQSCETPIGRMYLSTPSHLDFARDKYTFLAGRLKFYSVGRLSYIAPDVSQTIKDLLTPTPSRTSKQFAMIESMLMTMHHQVEKLTEQGSLKDVKISLLESKLLSMESKITGNATFRPGSTTTPVATPSMEAAKTVVSNGNPPGTAGNI